MELLIIFVIGVLIGSIGQMIINYKKVGILKVVHSDDDEPYLFLELYSGVDRIQKKKQVVLIVKEQHVDTQK